MSSAPKPRDPKPASSPSPDTVVPSTELDGPPSEATSGARLGTPDYILRAHPGATELLDTPSSAGVESSDRSLDYALPTARDSAPAGRPELDGPPPSSLEDVATVRDTPRPLDITLPSDDGEPVADRATALAVPKGQRAAAALRRKMLGAAGIDLLKHEATMPSATEEVKLSRQRLAERERKTRVIVEGRETGRVMRTLESEVAVGVTGTLASALGEAKDARPRSAPPPGSGNAKSEPGGSGSSKGVVSSVPATDRPAIPPPGDSTPGLSFSTTQVQADPDPSAGAHRVEQTIEMSAPDAPAPGAPPDEVELERVPPPTPQRMFSLWTVVLVVLIAAAIAVYLMR